MAGSTKTNTRSDPSLGLSKRLADVLHRHLSGALPAASVAVELREIAEVIEQHGKETSKEKRQRVSGKQASGEEQAIQLVFAHWAKQTGRNAAAKLTKEREGKIRARLREGYSVTDIIRAIDGCAASDFHNGANDSGKKYNDITLICRDGSKLESFRDSAPTNSGEVAPTREGELARLKKLAAEQLKEGDLDGYSKTQNSVRELGTA